MMESLITLAVLGVLALAGWVLLFTEKAASSPRLAREGEVHPWEEAADRAHRRRLNAIIEEELIRRAA